ncbi:MAG: IS3 family transposase, partial [Candidatus Eremiobacteraeota bacterium]|nr:IS3 family transposase [Candidatus Eremiobacteraeota bacterium]
MDARFQLSFFGGSVPWPRARVSGRRGSAALAPGGGDAARGARHTKKSGGLLRQGISVRCGFIEARRMIWRVSTMCRVLDVTRVAYYAWRRRTPSRRAQHDKLLSLHIASFYWRSKRSYGSTRTHKDLREIGLRCSQRRIARLMRSQNLVARRHRKYRVTTQSGHGYPVAPNVLDRNFAVATVEHTNKVWAGDITYIPTREGWLYLAVLLDLRSRRVIGRRLDSRLGAQLALDPLQQAIETRRLDT